MSRSATPDGRFERRGLRFLRRGRGQNHSPVNKGQRTAHSVWKVIRGPLRGHSRSRRCSRLPERNALACAMAVSGTRQLNRFGCCAVFQIGHTLPYPQARSANAESLLFYPLLSYPILTPSAVKVLGPSAMKLPGPSICPIPIWHSQKIAPILPESPLTSNFLGHNFRNSWSGSQIFRKSVRTANCER
jgi:hypothetical protein